MSMLHDVLAKAYQDAFMQMDVPQKRFLKSGLQVSITCHAEGVTLELARIGVYPAGSEWKTVCNYFPYFVGKVEPVQCVDGSGLLLLRGELPSRRSVVSSL